MSSPTAHYLEIENRLGRPLAAYIDEERGAGRSWRRIALNLTEATGIDVTGEALRVWHEIRRFGRETAGAA